MSKHSKSRKLLRRWARARNWAVAAVGCSLPLPSAFAQMVTVDYSFNVGADIADVGMVTDLRPIKLGITSITDVDVRLNISGRGDGGFNGEIYAQLSHLGAASILLNRTGSEAPGSPGSQVGYSDSGGFNVTFNDQAGQDVHWYRDLTTPTVGQALTGEFQPDGRNPLGTPVFVNGRYDLLRTQLLSEFNNLSPTGDWVLTVADLESGDTLDRLNGWGLSITGAQPTGGDTTFLPGTRVTGSGGDITFGSAVQLAGDTTVYANGRFDFTGPFTLSASATLKTDTNTRLLGGMDEIGGSRSFTKTGLGSLTIAGNATHSGNTMINEGRMIVNGSMTSSRTFVNSGGTLAGNGFLGQITLAGGGLIAPGNSVGSLNTAAQTWMGGGTLEWELNDATGTRGGPIGWDHLNINGSLDIQATHANPVILKLMTLDLSQTSGFAANFDSAHSYSWLLASTTAGVIGFDPNAILLNTSNWKNPYNGVFSLSLSGDNLFVNYSSVPEPGEYAALAGLGLLGYATWHRRRRSLAKL